MDAAAIIQPKRGAPELLQHLLALGAEARTRPSARLRLEQALGPELARKLVHSLTGPGRRRP